MSMHQVGRKLGVKSAHRKAMLSSLAISLIKYGRIETTLTRAKELRRVAEHMITLSKRGTLAARRKAATIIKDKDALKKLFSEMSEMFVGRNGGYTRIYKLGFRHGDNAPVALIEYISPEGGLKKKEETTESKKAKKSSKAKGVVEEENKIAKEEEKKEKTPAKKSKAKKEESKKEVKKGLFGRKKK